MKHIEELAPIVAENLLSKMALSMMPRAEIDMYNLTDEELYYSELVFKEIKKELGVSETDSSIEANIRVTEVLSKELDRLMLANSDISKIKERVGQKGLLNIQDYKIQFAPSFKTYQKIGIRRSHAERAIRDSFVVQHIFPEEFGTHNTDSISLFLQYPTSNFCLLVLAVRDHATLIVCHSWRIYRSDINMFQYSDPLSLMKAFIEKYGLEFHIGDNIKKTKFVFYKKFNKDLSKEINDVIEIFTPMIGKIILNIYCKPNKAKQTTEIALGFILDFEKYAKVIRQYK